MKKFFSGALTLTLLPAVPVVEVEGRGHSGRGGDRLDGHPGSHGHHHFHGRAVLIIGGGIWAPFWWGPYPYLPYPGYPYLPPVVVEQPPVYIQQAPPAGATATLEPGYWYYCESAKAYYPIVQQCPAGWVKIAPQAPPPVQE